MKQAILSCPAPAIHHVRSGEAFETRSRLFSNQKSVPDLQGCCGQTLILRLVGSASRGVAGRSLPRLIEEASDS